MPLCGCTFVEVSFDVEALEDSWFSDFFVPPAAILFLGHTHSPMNLRT